MVIDNYGEYHDSKKTEYYAADYERPQWSDQTFKCFRAISTSRTTGVAIRASELKLVELSAVCPQLAGISRQRRATARQQITTSATTITNNGDDER